MSPDGRQELEVRVSEAAAGGSANEAVLKLLAELLGVNRSEVTIISGHTSRYKRVALPYERGELRKRISRVTGKDEG
jgi:uncharacterized protein YggU (UPF0235/DUF167 family)